MANLAKQITKEQIIIALEYIIKNDISLIGSTKYDLEYKGKSYPPKEIVRKAAELANISNWHLMSLYGGDSTNEPLRKMGFIIKNRLTVDINQSIISKYKNIVSEDNKNEIYKWKLLNLFNGRPDISADNFASEITSINFGNLIYHNGIAVRNHMAKEFPEDYRNVFQNLFDEKLSLEERIVEFQNRVSEIYKKMGMKLNHHHDERTISTFLTFKYPEKYTLYKNSFYKSYCDLLGIKPESKNKKYIHYLDLVKNLIVNYITKDQELLDIKNKFLTDDCYPDTNHLIFAQDILYQVLNITEEISESPTSVQIMKKINQPLNQILFGPPGTGKTYSTIAKAINIVDPNFDSKQYRKAVKDEYKKLVESGQIVFTTFHQSMSYEDFVEGIKPMIEEDTQGNKSVVYDVEDGIFKKIVNQAKKIEKVDRADIDWNNVDYYKMSLGGKSNPQEHSYCIHNNLGGISWGGANDLTELATINDWSTYKNKFLEKFPDVAEKSSFNIQASFTLFRMKDGDIVIATRGNHIIDAIGKVSGSYIFNDENPTSLSHFRKIDWFAKDLNLSPEKFLKKNISQQSIYQFYNEDIKLDSFRELTATKDSSVKNYVLIIDEINRGNVSQIFGELITLIEDSKRLGKSEELQVILPYSKDRFGIPSNLYIIGTMNTADRSIEALDTALRRRFCFEEMSSQENLLSPSAMYCRLLWKYESVGWDDLEFVEKESNLFDLLGVSEHWHTEKVNIWDQMTKAENKNSYDYFSEFPITGINLQTLLEKINQRIEILLNRDHKIGHSYFIDVNSFDDLKSVFKNNIVPLLQEYFYGDYEKIGWILGEGFFVERKLDKNGVFTKFFKQPKPEFELEYQLADLDEIQIHIAVQKLLGTFKETTSTIEN